MRRLLTLALLLPFLADAAPRVSGGSPLATTPPPMDGDAAAGASYYGARADHAHPTDTSRAATDGGNATGTWPISISGSATFAGSASLAGAATTTSHVWNGVTDMVFHWEGIVGVQPPWIWGGFDQNNQYVYDPANFSVAHATTAGSADTATNATQLGGQAASYYQPAATAITTSNVATQSVAHAGTADTSSAVPWTGVSGRPTAVSSFTNDKGYLGVVGAPIGIPDVNAAPFGFSAWEPASAYRPSGVGSYGSLLTWSGLGTTSTARGSGAWMYQLGFDTNDPPNLVLRSSINYSGWGSWATVWTNYNFDPSSKLSLSGGTLSGGIVGPTFRVSGSGLAGNWAIDSTGPYLEAVGANPLRFYTNDSERLRIDASGNATFTGGVTATSFSGNASTATDASKLGGLSLCTNSAGPTWPCVPRVGVDGVAEVGRYLDFHLGSADGIDYTNRLETANGVLYLDGKAILHAGNYTSYAIPYSGTNGLTGFLGTTSYNGRAYFGGNWGGSGLWGLGWYNGDAGHTLRLDQVGSAGDGGGYVFQGATDLNLKLGTHTVWHDGNDAGFIKSRKGRISADDGTSLDQLSGALETGFNYGTSSGVVGPYLTFGQLNAVNAGSSYGAQFNVAYGASEMFRFRTRNDDAGSWNTWRTVFADRGYDATNVDTLATDPANNGIVQREGNGPAGYTYGGLVTMSSTNSRFQLYAPHTGSAEDHLWFRTGWNGDLRTWRWVVDDSDLSANETSGSTVMQRNGGRVAAASFALNSNLADLTSNAPWYGIGQSNLASSNGQYIQMAGYTGLYLRTSDHYLTLQPNGPAATAASIDGNVIVTAANIGTYAPAGAVSSVAGKTGAVTLTGPDVVTDRSDAAKDIGVAQQMRWKNYGSNHTIFDASAGTSPTGTTVDNVNAAIAWSGSFPTLMGWNGSSTYGVRVDSARVADSTPIATTSTKLRTQAGDVTFNWSGQAGQPAWLWGGNDPGTNMYVYNPANFSVNRSIYAAGTDGLFRFYTIYGNEPGTCGTTYGEGTLLAMRYGSGSTKICLCSYRAGTGYQWRNIFNSAWGNTCPDYN